MSSERRKIMDKKTTDTLPDGFMRVAGTPWWERSKEYAWLSVMGDGRYLTYRPSPAAVDLVSRREWRRRASAVWELDPSGNPVAIHFKRATAADHAVKLRRHRSIRPYFSLLTSQVGQASCSYPHRPYRVEETIADDEIVVAIPAAIAFAPRVNDHGNGRKPPSDAANGQRRGEHHDRE
jgi:hypothetical protein